METPLHSFETISSSFSDINKMSAFIAVLAIMVLIFLLRKKGKAKAYRQLFQMFAFFALLIAGGLFLFNVYFGQKLGPVLIYSEKIETPYGKIDISDIKLIGIVRDESYAPFSPQHKSDDKQLMIEVKTGERFFFSETHYEVQKIKSAIENLQ